MLTFNYHNETKNSGVIVSGDTRLTFRKFPQWDVDPVETRREYIESLINNPTCDVHTGSTKFMGWEFRFFHVRKYLVRTMSGICMVYGFSVKQLRDNAKLTRIDKVVPAPKGW